MRPNQFQQCPHSIEGDGEMDKVRVGFAGFGMMAQVAHLPNFLASSRCEVVAAADVRWELCNRVADRYGIKRRYRSHLELAEDRDVDAVVAINNDHLHAPLALDLMNAGKHVMIEKPMATNLDDARQMAEVSRAKDVKLMVAYTRRYDAGVLLAREVLGRAAESGMGDVFSVRSYYFGGNWTCGAKQPETTDEASPAIPPRFPSWLPAELQGRFMYFNNNLTHNIDLLRFLFGEPRGVMHVELKKTGVLAVLDFGDFVATLEGGRMNTDRWQEGTEVACTHGWLKMVMPPPLLKNVPAEVSYYLGGTEEGQVVRPAIPWSWAFKEECEHFLECILEDLEPRSPGHDSMKNVELVETVLKRWQSEN